MSKRFVVVPPEGEAYFYSCDGDTLPALQTLVGGLVDCVSLGNGVDGWINDEGRYTQPLNLAASLIARQPIYGVMVLAGSRNGETISLPDAPGLSDLPGTSLTHNEAVKLMVEAMEIRSMFAQVRELAAITGESPEGVLAGVLIGKHRGAAAEHAPQMATAGNVRSRFDGYL